MESVYLRLGLHVSATSREVIAAARARLTESFKRAPEHRATRHAFFRQILDCHKAARALRAAVR